MAVEDGEDLRRRFQKAHIADDGHLSSNAFNCKQRRPSVDRANLRPNLRESQFEPTDGLLHLVAAEVRAVCVPREGEVPGDYGIDVVERPLTATDLYGPNPSHACIETNPVLANDKRFRRLKIALAILAETRPWLIAPS